MGSFIKYINNKCKLLDLNETNTGSIATFTTQSRHMTSTTFTLCHTLHVIARESSSPLYNWWFCWTSTKYNYDENSGCQYSGRRHERHIIHSWRQTGAVHVDDTETARYTMPLYHRLHHRHHTLDVLLIPSSCNTHNISSQLENTSSR